MQKFSYIHHPSTQSSTLHTCLPPLRQKTGRQVKVNRGHNPTQTPNSTYTLFIVHNPHPNISQKHNPKIMCNMPVLVYLPATNMKIRFFFWMLLAAKGEMWAQKNHTSP